MTREEEIKLRAIDSMGSFSKYQGFIAGAKWADNNPRIRKVYVVVRCEEHDDYVEKVFVDNDKAVSYCENYNSNPREYSRTIEEMEVTL